jgi:tetratricopeptide (TPR) repeat protein
MEDIINQLAQIPDIRVPSATSMLYYRDNPKPYDEIIKELNVSYLLEASVRKMAGKAIMNITLIDADRNEQIWSDRIEMDLSVKDLFDVQFDVANAVANKMRIALENTKTKIPTSSYEAYDKFTKARDLIKFWNIDKNRQAIDLLLEAVKLDSQFLDAIVYLGQSYGQRTELSDGSNWLDSAQHYSAKAYEMDKHDAGAINALGYANVLAGNNLKGLELYLEAIKINPNTPYNYAGWCYHRLGKHDEAVLWAIKNIKEDPNNTIYYIDMGNACNSLGLFDYTKAYCDRALEINADNSFIYDNLWEMEFRKGNYKEAIEYSNLAYKITNQLKYQAFEGINYYKMDSLEKASARFSNNFRSTFDEELDDENSKIELYELMQYQFLTMIKLGQKKEGLKKLEELVQTIERSISIERADKYYLLAGCHATLGNTEKSIGYLETLLDKEYYNYYTFINSSLLDPLHNNADYKRIISIVKEKNDKMREKVLQNGNLTK